MDTKSTLVRVCAVGMGILLASTSVAELDPQQVLGLWLFDERDGETVHDTSGQAINGTFHNGVQRIDGRFGGAILCDGIDDYVEMTDPMNVELDGLSHGISLWANPGEKVQPAHADILGNQTLSFTGYDIEQRVNDQNVYYHGMGIAGAWAGAPVAVRPAATLEIGVWQHYVVQKNDITVQQYLNGELVVEYDVGADPVSRSVANLRLCLGQCCPERTWNGAIDELIIYPRAFTEDEIKGLSRGVDIAFAIDSKGKLTTTWGSLRRAY